MYDAIVIGARCAGSPTAMLLARKGLRVLLLDRASFPSDTLSTHVVKQPALAQLHKWGLLDQVIASNCPPIPRLRFDVGAFALVGVAPPGFPGSRGDYAPRRTVLDKILVDAAVDAGAELREQVSVERLLWEGVRVTGVRAQAADGSTMVEHAPIVIGADGMRSLVGRSVEAPEYEATPSLTCGYYSYWSGLPMRGAELYELPGLSIISFPTNDGLSAILTQWPHAEFDRVRANVDGAFDAALERVPEFKARVRQARREERWYGTADLPNFVRKPFGPGWALVGDAGLHRDPITGQGIADAFRDAELLSDAIETDSLPEYERRRNEAAMPIYQLTCQLATLSPTPEMQHLLASLQGNQAAIDRFIGAIVGTVAIPDFFAGAAA